MCHTELPCGVQWYRQLSLNSMLSNLMKSSHEVCFVAHKDPDQVFVADGGHYEVRLCHC